MSEKEWTVYIIRTEADTLYTGITKDMEKRFASHTSGKQGARFFNTSTPKEIVYQEKHPDRSSATKREIAIKKMNRAQKDALIKNGYPQPK